MSEFTQKEGKNGIRATSSLQDKDWQSNRNDLSVIRDFGSLFQIDLRLCDGCGLCWEVCPADIIVIEHFKAIFPPEKETNCYECGSCMSVCMHDAIFRV